MIKEQYTSHKIDYIRFVTRITIHYNTFGRHCKPPNKIAGRYSFRDYQRLMKKYPDKPVGISKKVRT